MNEIIIELVPIRTKKGVANSILQSPEKKVLEEDKTPETVKTEPPTEPPTESTESTTFTKKIKKFLTKIKKSLNRNGKQQKKRDEDNLSDFVVDDDKEENDDNDEEIVVGEQIEGNEGDVGDEDEDDEDYIDAARSYFGLGGKIHPFEEWAKDFDKKIQKDKNKMKPYEDFVEKLSARLPTFSKTLESVNLTDDDKEDIMWKTAILKHPDTKFDEDYILEAKNIEKTIEYFSKMTAEEFEKYKQLEEKFKTLKEYDKPLKNKILELEMDDKYKQVVYRHYVSHGRSSEKENKWMDTVLSIPWGKYNKIEIPDPKSIMEQWNKEVEGMIAVKEEFLLTLSDLATNPKINPKILTLKGVPGCGKTLFVQSISKILNLPVQWIDLAGMNEANFLKGFAKTWEGSKIGRLVEAIINMGSLGGIIVLEEIDKIEMQSSHGKEAMDTLVPILDRTRNHEFYDNYLSDIPVPLNNIIFICTCNDRKFPKYLEDRLNIMECEKPSIERKIKIASQYILPAALRDRNMNTSDIIFPDEIVKYIIEKYTNEDGVRTLKERMQSVVQRLNYFRLKVNSTATTSINFETTLVMPDNFSIPYTVTKKDVDDFLKYQKPEKDNLTYFM